MLNEFTGEIVKHLQKQGAPVTTVTVFIMKLPSKSKKRTKKTKKKTIANRRGINEIFFSKQIAQPIHL